MLYLLLLIVMLFSFANRVSPLTMENDISTNISKPSLLRIVVITDQRVLCTTSAKFVVTLGFRPKNLSLGSVQERI